MGLILTYILSCILFQLLLSSGQIIAFDNVASLVNALSLISANMAKNHILLDSLDYTYVTDYVGLFSTTLT